jgi:hypothetical protein
MAKRRNYAHAAGRQPGNEGEVMRKLKESAPANGSGVILPTNIVS